MKTERCSIGHASVRILAPAKINLHLRVGPPRDDGFHPLLSWFVALDWSDTLTLAPAVEGRIRLSCDRPDLACDESNLVLRAARALAATASESRGAELRLEKKIPLGAGLGGGSSDAAATLRGLNTLWKLQRTPQQLAELAATLGSDVPFFLSGTGSICRGRGERVQPVGNPRPRWATLLLPHLNMPTAAVYRRFDELNLGDDSALQREPDWHAWQQLDAMQLLPMLVNDLETPAFDLAPQLARLRHQAEQTLARPVRMSGSGSSLFSLFDQPEPARAAARQLSQTLAVDARVVQIQP